MEYKNIKLKRCVEHFNGLAWRYVNIVTKEELSIICHDGSYGREDGNFEIMAPWLEYDVQGHLGFKEVHKALLKLSKYKLDKK
jgi:hypothetical protein